MAILRAVVFGTDPRIGAVHRFGAVPRIVAVPEIGADFRIGAGVGEAEEEVGVAPDPEGVEDMANIDTFYCCWRVSNFARVATLYFIRNSLSFSVFARVCL